MPASAEMPLRLQQRGQNRRRRRVLQQHLSSVRPILEPETVPQERHISICRPREPLSGRELSRADDISAARHPPPERQLHATLRPPPARHTPLPCLPTQTTRSKATGTQSASTNRQESKNDRLPIGRKNVIDTLKTPSCDFKNRDKVLGKKVTRNG